MKFVLILFIYALSSLSYAQKNDDEKTRFYVVSNGLDLEFSSNDNQCKKFNIVSHAKEVTIPVTFTKDQTSINCKLTVKDKNECGINLVLLRGQKTTQVLDTFGDCNLAAKIFTKTQHFRKLVIGNANSG